MPGQPKTALRQLLHLGLLFSIGCRATEPSGPPPRSIVGPRFEGNALFGYAVAASGDHIAVAAPHAGLSGRSDAGAVFMFDRRSLSLVATIEPPDGADNTVFGFAIALDAGRLLVGAPRATVDGKAIAGAAYLFDAASGRLLHRLTDVPPQADGELGSSVGLHGDEALVGAPGSAVLGREHAGMVEVFDGGSGTLRRSLHLPEPEAAMVLGQSLAIAGDLILVGAPQASSGSLVQAGTVIVFDAASQIVRVLREPTPGAMHQFGKAISGSGTTVVIGAPNATVGGRERAGAAYVVDLATGAVEHRLHDVANPAEGELFGYSVALLEQVVVVGAPHGDARGTALGGAVYVFDRATGRQLARLIEPRPTGGADFGIAVGGLRDEIVVGAQNARGANGRGAAYAFPTEVLAGAP